MGQLKQLGVKAGWILGRLLPVDPKKIVFSSFYGILTEIPHMVFQFGSARCVQIKDQFCF